jgi:hypothetical protein
VLRPLICFLFRVPGTTRSAGTGAAPSSGSKRGKRCRAPMLGETGASRAGLGTLL